MFTIEDFFCGKLSYMKIDVSSKDVMFFLDAIMDEEMPEEFVLEVDEGVIKLNRIKKEFRVIKRNVTNNPCNADIQMMIVMKIAKRAGFKLFLEPKYSN
jgi:hypothetical protein